MDAINRVINNTRESQVIEEICNPSINIQRSKLFVAFIKETVDCGYLARFVIPSN